MNALLTRTACDRALITRTELADALDCCLTRIRHGVFVVRKECGTVSHDRIRTLAVPAALASDADIDRPGLPGHVAKMSVLVDSYRPALSEDEAFSHLSAGLLWGLPVTRTIQSRAEVIRPGTSLKYNQLLVRDRELPGTETTVHAGTRLTTATRTLVDVAHDYPLDVSVPMIDAALRMGLATIDDVAGGIDRTPARRGVRRARSAVEIADPLHESPAESICAVRFHEHGLDGFVPQVTFGSPDGDFRARVDFLHRDARLIVEVNGEIKYVDGESGSRRARQERQRDYRLRNMGYRVYQFTWADLFSPTVFHDLRGAITAAAAQ